MKVTLLIISFLINAILTFGEKFGEDKVFGLGEFRSLYGGNAGQSYGGGAAIQRYGAGGMDSMVGIGNPGTGYEGAGFPFDPVFGAPVNINIAGGGQPDAYGSCCGKFKKKRKKGECCGGGAAPVVAAPPVAAAPPLYNPIYAPAVYNPPPAYEVHEVIEKHEEQHETPPPQTVTSAPVPAINEQNVLIIEGSLQNDLEETMSRYDPQPYFHEAPHLSIEVPTPAMTYLEPPHMAVETRLRQPPSTYYVASPISVPVHPEPIYYDAPHYVAAPQPAYVEVPVETHYHAQPAYVEVPSPAIAHPTYVEEHHIAVAQPRPAEVEYYYEVPHVSHEIHAPLDPYFY